MRILIVEDEVRLAATLGDLLHINGYTVDLCHDGETGLDNALSGIYDLVILDGMLPKMDGVGVLKNLRKEGNATPVLMLTARSDLSDRVAGLDAGADYYLTKPFEPKELLACLRALIRRQPQLQDPEAITFGDLCLDQGMFSLRCGGQSVQLSRKEYDLMELLLRNQRQVITKETLLLKVWGYESDAEDNNVEVYISFLRKKLQRLRSQVTIRTIRRVGYCVEMGAGEGA
ncbi:response regulator transcription factor [Bengtsoniella intestinalis]|uniref:response regulator transcription factor n=1 Tax=Bengtsoniella intestinalis TaxID=3073143 RepID=UPI00391FAEE4